MKLVILDRDGVINKDSDAFIKSPDEWHPIPGSLKAIARLSRAGFRIFVATNQSGLSRGLFDIETLNAIHRKMLKYINEVGGHIEAILFCPHGPEDNCECRKPEPGLYNEIARRSQQNIQDVVVVGDSLRDIEAAISVKAHPILVRTGKGDKTLKTLKKTYPNVPVYKDLLGVSDALIKQENSHQ